MQFDLTISVEALQTVVGASIVLAILTMFTKHFLSDWRWTPLLVLGQGLILCVLGSLATTPPTAVSVGNAALTGLVAAALAVWGYEAVMNALGKIGVGGRSEVAQERKAREALLAVGYEVTDAVVRRAAADQSRHGRDIPE